MTIDPADFRKVLGHFPTGVMVVTGATDEGPAGMAIGSFASVSLEPPLVAGWLLQGEQEKVGSLRNIYL